MDVDSDEDHAMVVQLSYDELVEQEGTINEQLKVEEAALVGQPVDPLDPDYDGEKLEELNDRVETLREELKVTRSRIAERERLSVVNIQRMWRSRESRRAFHKMLQANFEKVYDHESGSYFYYNKKDGTTSWDKPKCLAHDPFGDDIDDVKEIGRPSGWTGDDQEEQERLRLERERLRLEEEKRRHQRALRVQDWTIDDVVEWADAITLDQFG